MLGRGEYLKLNSESYSTSSSRSSVCLEILFGLAGEADDDVGGDGDVAALAFFIQSMRRMYSSRV